MLRTNPSHQSQNGCVSFSEFLDLKHRDRPLFESRNIGANQTGKRSAVLLLRDDEKSENAQFSASILPSGPRLSIERPLARGYVETINTYSSSESEGYLALFHGR